MKLAPTTMPPAVPAAPPAAQPHRVDGWIELVWFQPLASGGRVAWNLGLLATDATGVLTTSVTRREFDRRGRLRDHDYGIGHAGSRLSGASRRDAELVFRALREVMSRPRTPGFFLPAKGDEFGVVLQSPLGPYREMFPMRGMAHDPAATAARQALEAAARLAPAVLAMPIP